MCPTLCDPTDSSPPGSPVPGILQVKNTGVGCHFLLQCMKVKSEVKSLSRVQPSATPWTAASQAPPSMGFSRQEYWSGVPLPSPILQQLTLILLFFVGLFTTLCSNFPLAFSCLLSLALVCRSISRCTCTGEDDTSDQEQIAQVTFCLQKLKVATSSVWVFLGRTVCFSLIFICLADLGLSCSLRDL